MKRPALYATWCAAVVCCLLFAVCCLLFHRCLIVVVVIVVVSQRGTRFTWRTLLRWNLTAVYHAIIVCMLSARSPFSSAHTHLPTYTHAVYFSISTENGSTANIFGNVEQS